MVRADRMGGTSTEILFVRMAVGLEAYLNTFHSTNTLAVMLLMTWITVVGWEQYPRANIVAHNFCLMNLVALVGYIMAHIMHLILLVAEDFMLSAIEIEIVIYFLFPDSSIMSLCTNLQKYVIG